MFRRVTTYAALVLILWAGVSCVSNPGGAEQTPEATPSLSLRPNKPAPPDQFREDSYRSVAATGRPQLIEFFAHW